MTQYNLYINDVGQTGTAIISAKDANDAVAVCAAHSLATTIPGTWMQAQKDVLTALDTLLPGAAALPAPTIICWRQLHSSDALVVSGKMYVAGTVKVTKSDLLATFNGKDWVLA